jgi:hypothetical protein
LAERAERSENSGIAGALAGRENHGSRTVDAQFRGHWLNDGFLVIVDSVDTQFNDDIGPQLASSLSAFRSSWHVPCRGGAR